MPPKPCACLQVGAGLEVGGVAGKGHGLPLGHQAGGFCKAAAEWMDEWVGWVAGLAL